MMKKTIKRKLFTWFLIFAMLIHLSSCLRPQAPVDYDSIKVKSATVTLSDNTGFSDFDSQLIKFMSESGFKDSDFMVSPLSFRYALALATAGAHGKTQEQLLKAAGFETMEAYAAWAEEFNGFVEYFSDKYEALLKEYDRYPDMYGDKAPDFGLSVANSAWHNADLKDLPLSADYARYIKEHFGAEAYTVPAKQLCDGINSWVKENTKGLIPRIVNDDAEKCNTILVNTLYLKDGWTDSFSESATKQGVFTCRDGNEKTVDYMNRTDRILYYADDDTALVILPMHFGVNVAFVLGSTEGLSEKLGKAKTAYVHVQIPKFSTETSLEKKELVDFLRQLGVSDAFIGGVADFTPMVPNDSELYIDDIIQKTKISVDEDGIEAAAATAILMKDSAIFEPDQPVEFIADRPFSYFIYTSVNNTADLMFFGQYTGVEK
ncbi:MAG: hypothetical protein IKS28_09140 [Clostridia bacterium]|nr:hypothetical protein [Clostridia bacterium]